MIDGNCFTCHFPWATACNWGDMGAEPNSFRLHRHCGEHNPWIIGGHTLIALPDYIIFQKNPVPPRIFGKLCQSREAACIAPGTTIRKTESILHIYLYFIFAPLNGRLHSNLP